MVIADESTGDEVRRFALCAVGNKDEDQLFKFTPQESLTQFRLKINTDDGNTGNWGVGRIVVVTADPAFAPSGLAVVKTNANYFVLGWVNGANTVSNRVDVKPDSTTFMAMTAAQKISRMKYRSCLVMRFQASVSMAPPAQTESASSEPTEHLALSVATASATIPT